VPSGNECGKGLGGCGGGWQFRLALHVLSRANLHRHKPSCMASDKPEPTYARVLDTH